MIGLLQRVTRAWVEIDQRRVAEIGVGLMVLVGVEPEDDDQKMRRLLERLLNYRVFADDNGKMNCSLKDIQGGFLLVPQFTLTANTSKGNRPGFSTAAPPQLGRRLFEAMVTEARERHKEVEHGVFGADMQVGLVNDGPVTLWLHVR